MARVPTPVTACRRSFGYRCPVTSDPRRPYTQPRLIHYGRLTQLTASGVVSGMESKGMGTGNGKKS